MKILAGIIAFLYTIVFLGLGIFCVSISLDVFTQDKIMHFINTIYASPLNQIYTGLVGIGLLILVLIYIYAVLKKGKKKRTISFQNPDGEVTISLAAIENFVNKIARDVTEIRDLECRVTGTKRGIKVLNKATIISGVSIPELTEKFQEMIKLRLQEMLGIEGRIEVVMYVKEVLEEERKKTPYGGEIDYSR